LFYDREFIRKGIDPRHRLLDIAHSNFRPVLIVSASKRNLNKLKMDLVLLSMNFLSLSSGIAVFGFQPAGRKDLLSRDKLLKRRNVVQLERY